MVYDFQEQLRKGKEAENILDFFWVTKGAHVEVVDLEIELKFGIDRIITDKNGFRVAVEYKTDFLASHTGNAFIETVSVNDKKAGWAYTSLAQVVHYFLPDIKMLYIIPTIKIKKALPEWTNNYKKASANNGSYHSEGILVPLTEFEEYGTLLEV